VARKGHPEGERGVTRITGSWKSNFYKKKVL